MRDSGGGCECARHYSRRLRHARRSCAARGVDAFVARIPGGDLVQTSAWAATKRGVGLETELVLVRDRTGRCVGGGLLVVKRLRAGLAAGYVARGPLAQPSVPGTSAVVLDAVIDRARSLRISCLVVQPPEGEQLLDAELRSRGFQEGAPEVAPGATIRLDLAQSNEQLLLGMRKARRREIRRAIREEVDISLSSDVELFHRLHTATAIRQGFAPLSLNYLEHQWRELAPNTRLAFLLARHTGAPAAGVWLTSFNGVVTFRLAGWDASIPSPKYVNEALHWRAIQWARDVGAASTTSGVSIGSRPVTSKRRAVAARFYAFLRFLQARVRWLTDAIPTATHSHFNRWARHAVAKSGLLAGRHGEKSLIDSGTDNGSMLFNAYNAGTASRSQKHPRDSVGLSACC